MDLSEIGDLLERIAIHYPTFEKQISKDGRMSRAVAEEWHRLIGFLTYEDAIKRLDSYLMSDDCKKPPMAVDFLKHKARKETDVFHAPINHNWKIIKGRLYDEEDREYVVDPTDENPYYFDEGGNICQGKIIRFYRKDLQRSQ